MICLKCYDEKAHEDSLGGPTSSITLISKELKIDYMYLIDLLCRSNSFSFTDEKTGEVVEFKRI